MFRPRIIPVLLLKKNGIVKSVQFSDHRYIGDPINAVRIFNDQGADELVFLDIFATKENRVISAGLVKNIGEEANMPFSVGGGIRSLEDIELLLRSGAERVVLNTIALQDPDFVKRASDTFGSSTIVICLDVKKNFFGTKAGVSLNGTVGSGKSPADLAGIFEDLGAGEIILQSVDRDGTMQGYDMELIKVVSEAVTIPVVALGGAGTLDDLKNAYELSYATGVAAGSIFVYHGPRHGILINYPQKEEINALFPGK